jgi:hypothetical protein
MKRTGVRRAVLGVGLALAAVVAGPAGANDDVDKYQGDKKNVSVQAQGPNYDGTNTTFTFTLSATENVSHVVLMTCPNIQIVSATGPQGANKEGDAPKQDSSIKDEGHVGIKFEPGVPGTYTIVFAGNIAGAEFVVKDGDGHKHFTAGDANNVCKPPVSTQQPPSTPSGQQPQQQPPSGGNPSNPNNQGASNQTGGAGTQVAGNTQTRPGSDVLGNQLTAPEAQATLPRTGLPVPALAPIGTMFLALGGLATALGRWPRG